MKVGTPNTPQLQSSFNENSQTNSYLLSKILFKILIHSGGTKTMVQYQLSKVLLKQTLEVLPNL